MSDAEEDYGWYDFDDIPSTCPVCKAVAYYDQVEQCLVNDDGSKHVCNPRDLIPGSDEKGRIS